LEAVSRSEEVVIRMDRRRTAFAALLGFIFVPIGASMVKTGSPLVVGFGVLCLVFFGLGSLLLVASVIRPMVVIAFDDQGVRFGGALPSFRYAVPWDEIGATRIFRFDAAPLGPGMRMLGFVPVDPDSPVWKRRLSRTNRRMVGVPASIAGNSIGIELEQVVELMRRFRPELQLEYGDARAAGLGKVARPSQWGRHN
jgi:hypothetical protein